MPMYIIFTIILSVSSTDFLPKSNNDDLINFIDLLNNRDDDDYIGKSKYLQTLTDTELKRSNEQDKLTEMTRLLQMNYEAREDKNNYNRERLHFIRNPEFIDDYRSQMRKRSSHELLYDGDFDEDTLKQLLLSLRRNAVFRLNKEKSLRNSPALRLGSNIGDPLDPIKPVVIRDDIAKKYDWGKSLERQRRVKPKLRKAEERYKPRGGFGRTSIPFAGKRGVFEDN
ncbi:uncharacterized protein LOC111001790 isoform X2 [Pieris rapae]|uniref:uncharacterized protein LOC111001790 isoform X2 n=1 Tax=Pieris rapae TaxID=64459 RepID=UPI001E27E17D|nr:uncharacterized protein LOC111001790 isoform X2 [Pieris rapae]